jgi:uncharacterized protein (TIGR03437 family)
MNTGKSRSSIGILLVMALGCFDTARGQGTLTASPSQLTFNTQSGVATASQTLLLTSSAPASVTITPFSTNNWLVVTPSSGTTPLTLTVSVGAAAPTSGTSVAYINATSSAGSLSIQVTLNANSGGTSPLTANPNSLSFTFPPNSTLAATQNASVSSSSSSITTFTATGTTSNGANWLTVNPVFGSVPGSFQVTVNPMALGSAGTYNAAVAINAPGTTGTVVPVLVTLQGTPALNVTPSQLSFGYQIGTSVPAAQTLSLTSSTGSNVGFSATAKTTTCGSNWIVLSQTSGATPGTLTVQVNTTGLMAGPCVGEIDIMAPFAANPSIAIPVGLLVSTSPLLQVPSTGPTFNYQIGGATPAAQNVQVTSSTAGVSFTAAANPNSGGPNFLQVSPTSGTTPQSLALTLNAAVLAGLGPGTYTENVTITSASAGNSPQTFAVTLVVSSNPTLISSVPALNFNYQIGQTAPQSQTLTVSSSGAPLNYQVSTTTANCSGFLTATPANGSTYGSQNQIVVSVGTTGLVTPQVCSGNVVLSVPGTSTSLQIPVSLNVSNTALLNVSQGVISVTALAGSTAVTQQTISVTSTDNSSLTFNATASTSPVGLSWLSVTPNSAATPSNVVATINPTGLAVGTYSGSITVQGSGSASSIPAQTIPVTLTIASSTVTATPTSLTFAQSVGGSAPASQTIQINGVPAGTTIGAVATVFNGSGNWLTASVSNNTVTVNANGSLLALGTYTGVVTVIVPGALGSPLYVPVTLAVGAAPTLSVSPTTVNFAFQIGTQVALTAQAVQVSSTGSNVPFTATFTPQTGGAFVTVTPTSGTTPTTLGLTLNAVVLTLAPGAYSGTITVASPNVPGGNQTVTVNLTVTAGPTPVVLSVTNAGSFQPGPISPGEIITLFGNNIGPATPASGTGFQFTAAGTVPTTLAGVTVTIGNVKAPLIFVGPTQINAIVPYEVFGQTTANVVVSLNGAMSTGTLVQVVPTSPSIFTLEQNGSGQGAILNQNNSVNSVFNPAAKGSIIQMFGTGEGQLVPRVQTGCVSGLALPLPTPVATPVTVTIGGQPATPVTYAGEAPTLVCGVIQINATVPTNIGSGPQTVVVTIGSNTNVQQNVTVAVGP